MSTLKWWEVDSSISDGQIRPVILLQIDLAGHSRWGKEEEAEANMRQAATERMEFSLVLRSLLSQKKFDCLYWLGDGGVFAKQNAIEETDADAAIDAGDAAFQYFVRCRQTFWKESKLGLRVTATIAESVLHRDASQWFGTSLNEFLKFEREFAVENALVITGELRRKLGNRNKARFPSENKRRTTLPNGKQVTVFIEKNTTLQRALTSEVKDSRSTFLHWLNSNSNWLPQGEIKFSNSKAKARVGEDFVLGSALDESGYPAVRVTYRPPDLESFEKCLRTVASEWERAKAKEEREGVKAAPIAITHACSDEPSMTIELAHVPFRTVKAFHDFLLKRPDVRDSLWEDAFAVGTGAGRHIVGTLSLHTVLILEDDKVDGRPLAVLGHRPFRDGGYSGECWSASFEEQFSPVREPDPATPEKLGSEFDQTPIDAVLRGVREEFLGKDFSDPIQAAIHAVFLDARNLNIELLAVVRLPRTTFSQVRGIWKSGQPKDHVENDALLSLPMDADVLKRAIVAKSPSELIAHLPEDLLDSSTQESLKHQWHPSSRLRLACCLWMVEQGFL